MFFKGKDIPNYNMIPEADDFMMIYDGYDSKTDNDIWMFIELSICGVPVESDKINIPRSDVDNKEKYILEHLKRCCNGPYVCIKNEQLGVWNHRKHKFYEFVDQSGSKDEIIKCLLEHIYQYKQSNKK